MIHKNYAMSLVMVFISICSYPCFAAEEPESFYICKGGEAVIYDNLLVIQRDGDIYGRYIDRGNEFPICTQPDGQYSPKTNGKIVLWADNRNRNGGTSAPYDIYAYDIALQKEYVIACNPSLYYDHDLDINGSFIVYAAKPMNGNYYSLYGYDLSTHNEFVIDNSSKSNWLPRISGNRVIYSSNSELWLYDNVTKVKRKVCSDVIAGGVSFDGNIVVWRSNKNGNYEVDTSLLSLDLLTNKIAEIWPAYSDVGSPLDSDINNGFIVFRVRHVSDNNSDIYGYDIYNKNLFSICSMPEARRYYPKVFGNIVVWNEEYSSIMGVRLPVNQLRCISRPAVDLNNDCKVDFLDFVMLSEYWLECNLNPQDLCLK